MKIRTLLISIVVIVVGLVGFVSCGSKQPSRWDAAQEQTQRNAPAVVRESVAGGEFNKFFPKSAEQFDIIYTQEKDGFAQASLKENGANVALLTISDTVNTPDAREKFQGQTRKLAGHPIVQVGQQATALLIADRFQVQIRSQANTFDVAEREAWLQKFDLAGLSKLP